MKIECLVSLSFDNEVVITNSTRFVSKERLYKNLTGTETLPVVYGENLVISSNIFEISKS